MSSWAGSPPVPGPGHKRYKNKRDYLESSFAKSVKRYIFFSLNNLTASFQALFIGSRSNFSLASVRNSFRSSVKTVALVLVSSFSSFCIIDILSITFTSSYFLMLLISFFLVIILFILSTKEPETQSINKITNHNIIKGRKLFLSLDPAPSYPKRAGGHSFRRRMTKMEAKFKWYEEEVFENCIRESLAGLDAKLGHPRTCPIKRSVA